MACATAMTLIERLERCAVAQRADKVVARLAACSIANRPASSRALLNFVGRTLTFKAHVLDAHDVAGFLLNEGLPNSEMLHQAQDMLKACSLDPLDRVTLSENPEASKRILMLSKSTKLFEMSLQSLASWILAQSYIQISVSSATVVHELVRSGHVQEKGDGSIIFCKFDLEASTVDVRLFAERYLRNAVPHPKARDLFEMHLPVSESSPAATGSTVQAAYTDFEDLGLNRVLVQSLGSRGLKDPSEIQQLCIPPLLEGRDVLAQARSGTGKTVALAIAALQRIDFAFCGERQEPRCPCGHRLTTVLAHRGFKCASAMCVTRSLHTNSRTGNRSDLQENDECLVCGCASEFDSLGDRICWCDECWYGCIPRSHEEDGCDGFEDPEDEYGNSAMEQGVRCNKCAWSACKGCYEHKASTLMQKVPVPRCQVLVVVPTRELANQIHHEITVLGKSLGVRCHACIGGTSVRDDIDSLRNGQHIVVGNTGRIFDMLSKRHLQADNLKLFVMDEGDAMLSGTFKDQVYNIFKCLPASVQVGVFSTVMPPEVVEITCKFLRNPSKIVVEERMLMPARVRHFCMVGGGENKVRRLLGVWGLVKRALGVIVFCQSRRAVDSLAQSLSDAGLAVSCLHAELDQRERELVIREFRKRQSKVLLCTNEFGRGLNMSHVGLVVNYDIPSNAEDYLLRSGRCGRFGRSGVVITLVAKRELSALHSIARQYHMHIDETNMGTIRESLQPFFEQKN